ncbi:hypothetical protein [Roseivirga sp. E12]|uniref:hypothetical protein n=1 Tax=Roseivirga sp. E12 TaxID=2819237 RepID=UPI001ABC9F77|nr:hypothetical protein [Roseivirga sp. E12]MBO3698497.1 hypothetical protein [Roseivirga sp. E12]
MRITHFSKVLLAITALGLVAIGCNKPPDLPDAPAISFDNITFQIRNEGDPLFEETVLSLSFNVEDGNGDLGLDGNENNAPYNSFGLVTGPNGFIEFGERPTDPPFSCVNYVIEDRENLDLNNDADFLDTLLINFNENQFNIEVDFLVKNNGVFEELEMRAQPRGSANKTTLCGISFDGRFPCLSSEDNPCDFIRNNDRPIEGVVTYEMNSGLFLPIFRTDTLMLEFKIRDRALNESNVARTEEFTLQGITIASTN